MLTGQVATGRAKNRRYVPIVTGVFFIAGALFLPIWIATWWSILPGVVCLMFGWASLKTGLFGSAKEIAELTEPGPVSEETKRKVQDRL